MNCVDPEHRRSALRSVRGRECSLTRDGNGEIYGGTRGRNLAWGFKFQVSSFIKQRPALVTLSGVITVPQVLETHKVEPRMERNM